VSITPRGTDGYRRRLRRRYPSHQRDRGATLVEFAIVFPVVLFAVLAVLQAAFYFLARAQAIEAARAGVAAERAYNAPAGTGVTKAGDYLGQTPDWLLDTTITSSRDATSATVVISGRYRSVLPGVTWTITQSAHGPIERFVP
jgi:Flp pilus assembly protein TadG